ncbi:zinc finger protein 729-like [Palaemon carinicauda]|uniref:zinc finger protein 729-like n=1 Tax=Palaemon carinicauda TaxID=392227 RepID=UPI0035B5AF0D
MLESDSFDALTMDQEKHNLHSLGCQTITASCSDTPHSRPVHTEEALVTEVLSNCPSSNDCNESHPPIILSSDLCELTSKYEGEALIKVDSMLAEPCKYLKGVSVFGVDDGEENDHHDLVGGSVELGKSMEILKEDCGNNSKKLIVGNDHEDQSLKVISHGNEEEHKDARMNLLDSSPFLMNEEGVVFQCFPVSEKEVFIVSLEEEALLMNETLTEDALSIASDHPSQLKLGNPGTGDVTKAGEGMMDKFEGGSQYSILSTSEADSYIQNVPSSSFMSSSFHEPQRKDESQDSRLMSRGVLDNAPPDLVCQSELPPTNNDNCSFLSEKEKTTPLSKNDEYQEKEYKVTHATIFAPPLPPPPTRRMRKGTSEGGEAAMELYRCSICNEALPTSGTLRHHLINRHQQSNLDSFMCFLCKQDCWSASQQDWHLRIQHGIRNKALACLVCGTQFATITEHRAHVRKHPANLTCPSCPKKFASQHQLTAHVKQHLEELQPHGCEQCGIRFSHPKILEMHGWRHRSQDCPEESCGHVAEDESWLLHHLQDHHKQSSQSANSLTSSRNADEYRMDILLVKYFQIKKSRLDVPPSDSLSKKIRQSKGCNVILPSPFVLDAKESDEMATSLMKDSTDFTREGLEEVSSQMLSDMVGAVVAIEEEEKKNVKRKEETLRKVFDGGTSSFRCGLCNTYHSTSEELAVHKAEHNQVLECIKCQKSFLSVKQLKRHMTVHASYKDDEKQSTKGMNEHHCLLCGKVFGSESALSRHSSTHARSEGRHQCKVCSRRVGTRAHLTEHMSRVHKIHSDSKKMQCPMCDRRFVSSFHLNLHLITHGEVKPLYSCKVCNRNYLRPRSLRRHMATHDEKFVCKTCNESFPSARRLALHVRTHNPAYKSKVQCPKCPLAFPYKSQLEVHLRTHTGEKPYVCETCGKSFKRLQHCTVHLRVMHGNEKQPCKECGKPFSDKANLLRHRLKVHYHLNRWVCGVCAQSFAYSEDLRRHLKKIHNLVFERLVSSNKKCMSEVYVIPELGTREISANTRAAIECICEMEKQKVKQIFNGGVPDLTKPLQKPELRDGDRNDDPDDPVLQQGDTVATGGLCIPTTTVGLPAIIGNGQLAASGQSSVNLQACYGVGEMPGLMPLPVTGVKCTECGVDVVTPQQCGLCGVLLCTQTHLDSHTASVHQVLFQCSVCGQHYNSQSECITHVTNCHSSHLLTVQGTTATYLPAGQAQPLQNNGGFVQTQLCLPFSNSQSNSQCILQVGSCPPQLPVLVAPAGTAVGSQQLNAPNCVLPYTNFVNGWSQTTALGPPCGIGKQAVYAMTNIFSDQQSPPDIQCAISRLNKKEPETGTQVCTITLPPENSESLSTSEDLFSSKPCSNVLPTILPRTSSSGKVPQLLVGDSELSEHQDENAQLLLVDSGTNHSVDEVSHSSVSRESVSQDNLSRHHTSTSVASVLLTLAETPQEDQTSMLVPGSALRIPDSQVDKVLSPSNVPDASIDKIEKDSTITAGNASFFQTIGIPEQPKDDLVHNPSFALSQVADDSVDSKYEPISVEIIQPQLVKPKSEPNPKPSPKKSSSRTKRKKTIPSEEIETHECKICGKILSSSSQLKRHETTHGARRFKCQLCDKAFTEKYNLKIHTLTHTQERPHECSLCQKRFRYLRDLAEHKRMHEGTRPHVCEVCQKTFVRQRDLTRHQREQHDAKRYQCKICGLYFKRLLYLKSVHMRIHHPLLIEADEEAKQKEHTSSKAEAKQSHICKICGRNFARARYLTSHLRTHSKRANYVRCSLCPRMFSTEQTLKIHKETFHNPRPLDLMDENLEVENGDIQGETAVSNFDQPHTENLVISESQEMAETATPLIISTHSGTEQMQTLASKLLLPSNTSHSIQQSYTAPGTSEGLEVSLQTERISHYDVNMDECDPITYLTPSFTS